MMRENIYRVNKDLFFDVLHKWEKETKDKYILSKSTYYPLFCTVAPKITDEKELFDILNNNKNITFEVACKKDNNMFVTAIVYYKLTKVYTIDELPEESKKMVLYNPEIIKEYTTIINDTIQEDIDELVNDLNIEDFEYDEEEDYICGYIYDGDVEVLIDNLKEHDWLFDREFINRIEQKYNNYKGGDMDRLLHDILIADVLPRIKEHIKKTKDEMENNKEYIFKIFKDNNYLFTAEGYCIPYWI